MNEIETIQKVAEIVKKSGITRESLEQIALKGMIARSLNLDPIQGIFGFDLLQTRSGLQIFMKPILMEAKVRSSGKYRYEIKELSDERCILLWYERVEDKWTLTGEISFTMEEAKKQNLANKDNWLRVPKEMLFYRCLARAVRMLASDVIFGIPIYLTGVEEWEEPRIEEKQVDEAKRKELQEQFNEYINTIEVMDDDGEDVEWGKVAKRFEPYGIDPSKVWNLFFGDAKPTKGLARALLGFCGLQKYQEANIEVLEKIREVL